MDAEARQYAQEMIDAKREIRRLEQRVQELSYILLPEVQNGNIQIDGATLYLINEREPVRLSKELLTTVLTDKYGASMAEQIIALSSRTLRVQRETVGVRLSNEDEDVQT